MTLFFDLETTGKADFRAPIDAKHQPHIVQLGCALFDDDGKERCCMDVIIKPYGWTIPAEAANIHGITTEIAEKCGVKLVAVLSVLSGMLHQADLLVAHNIDFDTFILAGELQRLGDVARKCMKRLGEVGCFCTMKATAPICKLPGRYGDFKWPKLTEAYQHLFNESFDGAHSAMVDVRACARVYFALPKEDGK